MTTKDKIVARIGPVNVYSGGYLTNPDNHNILIKERLLEFLNIDSTSEDQVNAFCERYAFLPRDITKGWLIGFAQEQEALKKISIKLLDNSISVEDIALIESQRTNIYKQKPTVVSKNTINELQNALQIMNGNDYYNKVKSHLGTNILIETNERNSSVSSLWDEMYSRIKSKQNIKQCIECKQFFNPNKHSPWQKFCDNSNCKDRFHNKKRGVK